MKHPNQATLALHAGGDLGRIARWRTGRHVARCERCREEMAAFEGMRQALPDLAEMPEINWNRLAAEMKANIRLGLAAGECVRASEPLGQTPLFGGARAVVAMASLMALVAAGLVLQHPAPVVAYEPGIVVEATADGIRVSEGGQAMGLLTSGAEKRDVTYTVGAQGSMEARYVDRDTGYVTVNTLDVY
jgi:hypothetical protein